MAIKILKTVNAKFKLLYREKIFNIWTDKITLLCSEADLGLLQQPRWSAL